MNKGIFVRFFICILFFGFCLYSYIDMQNEITHLRIQIPELTKEVRRIEEENTQILYEIETFESPENLMRLAQSKEYSFLKYPMAQEVLTLKETTYVKEDELQVIAKGKSKPKITFATSAKP